MPTTASITYLNNPLRPAIDSGVRNAVALPIKLAASSTFAKGAILGEKTGNNEKVSLVVDATGGTFTATFGGDTTSAIAYNATAATLEAALEALDAIGSGNVSVTQHKRVWTLTNANGSDGGTFHLKVTYNGEEYTTSALTYDDTAADIDTAIEALPHLPDTAVTVTGSAGGPWVLTFVNTLSGPLEVEVVQDSTTDGTVWEGGIVVTEVSGTALQPYIIEFTNDLGNTNVGAVTTGVGSLTGGNGTATVAVVTAGSSGTPGEFDAYDSTATNGLQTPRCILPAAMITDASGNITITSTAGISGGEHSETYVQTDAWFEGAFNTADVPAITNEIISAMGGKMLKGTIANNGIFVI